MKILMSWFLLLSLGGCAYSVHQYSALDFTGMTGMNLKNATKVSATGEKKYILIKTDNDFVDIAYANLMDKCKDGAITGITTKYLTALSFFSFDEKLELEGYCIK